jgi:hypothetical protein
MTDIEKNQIRLAALRDIKNQLTGVLDNEGKFRNEPETTKAIMEDVLDKIKRTNEVIEETSPCDLDKAG